jgi:hypothetical protein
MLVRVSRMFESLTLVAVLALGSACMAMAQQPNTTSSTPPVIPGEMDNFSQFLLNHQGIAKQLQQNPSLIGDPNFQAQHPQLQTFLKNHPGVAQQVKANPTQFVKDTQQFMARGGEITGWQAGRTDQFLDNHPEIAQELRKDPSLIDSKQYLEQHPQLQQYLNDHPDIRKEWKEHPEAFERREAQYEQNEKTTDRHEMDHFSQFLLNHEGIAKQLQQNPSLINDPNFQAQHPQLQTFLQDHPGVAQQVKSNPTQFVKDTQQFMSRGGEISGGQAGMTDQFLDNHPQIAQQLRKNPNLIDDPQYLQQHPQLQQYLNDRPDIRKEWKEHPEAFERREAQYQKNHPPKSKQANAQKVAN